MTSWCLHQTSGWRVFDPRAWFLHVAAQRVIQCGPSPRPVSGRGRGGTAAGRHETADLVDLVCEKGDGFEPELLGIRYCIVGASVCMCVHVVVPKEAMELEQLYVYNRIRIYLSTCSPTVLLHH